MSTEDLGLGEGNTIGYAARDKSGVMTPWRFNRRSVGENDVHITITHSGICHSDLHTIRGEWGGCHYPLVAGHEISGTVKAVGTRVTKFSLGDRVGVGCMVDSCGSCEACERAEEELCEDCIFTYDSTDVDGSITQGGYSSQIVVNQRFVFRIPDGLSLEHAAPLLCAGITVYSPIMRLGLAAPGKTLGVIGLGGLGHLAVKFGKALGAKVVVFSTSAKKEEEAKSVLGADEFVVTTDPAAMEAVKNSIDNIIDTVAADHELKPFFKTLKIHGQIVMVGLPEEPLKIESFDLVTRRNAVSGSMIGGTKATEEMLQLCAEKNITPLIELVPMNYVNEAHKRMEKADVRYRFVIDTARTLNMGSGE